MDINRVINSIRDSKAFQYSLAAIIFSIVVYSGMSLFLNSNNTEKQNVPNNAVKNAVVKLGNSDVFPNKNNLVSYNQKRVLQEIETNYKKANNPNALYIAPQGSGKIYNNEISNTDLKIENKIYQVSFDKLEKKAKQKKNNHVSAPAKKVSHKKKKTLHPLSLTLDNIQTQKNPAGTSFPSLNVLNIKTTKENMEEKIELYKQIYNYVNADEGIGTTVVKQAYWNEIDKTRYYHLSDNNANQTNIQQQNLSANNGSPSILKIVPGSSFFAKLVIPIENIYMNDVKPIAEIVNGPLKGYRLIGTARTTSVNDGIILKFNRLISPAGKETSVSAVGVQVQSLSPKFVDSIDRHTFPKIVLATLASISDALFNRESGNNNYTAPAQSILSQELQNMIQEYQTEIKVNPKYFVVIFY